MSSTPFRYAAAPSPASPPRVSARSKSSTTEQQLQQQADDGLVGLLAAFAIDALPVVVELGRLAQQTIAVVVAFALQLRDLFGREFGVSDRRVARRASVPFGRFVSHRA